MKLRAISLATVVTALLATTPTLARDAIYAFRSGEVKVIYSAESGCNEKRAPAINNRPRPSYGRFMRDRTRVRYSPTQKCSVTVRGITYRYQGGADGPFKIKFEGSVITIQPR